MSETAWHVWAWVGMVGTVTSLAGIAWMIWTSADASVETHKREWTPNEPDI